MMKTILRITVLIGIIGIGFTACNTSSSSSSSENNALYSSKSHSISDRPNNPWVFRSVLDSIPRVVTFALNTDLWVAYSAENGAMYKAWKGNVNFDGPVYTTSHGPQPTTIGDSWMVNNHQNPWIIIKGEKETTPKEVKYKGHRYQNGHAHLKYQLILDDKTTIDITEQPEYVTSASGSAGLERTFKTSNVPNDVKIALKTNVSSVSYKESIKVEGGEYEIKSSEERTHHKLFSEDFDGVLHLASNGTTKMTTFFVKKPMLDHPKKHLMKNEVAVTDKGYLLIEKNGCKTCHHPLQKTIGPAYLNIAKVYKNNRENVSTLINKVKKGGAGNWGETPMKPHPEISDDDIETMVGYIMSLDAEEEAKLAEEEVVVVNVAAADVDENDLQTGILTKFFQAKQSPNRVADLNWTRNADYEGILGTVALKTAQVKWTANDFGFSFDGYWRVNKAGRHVVRLMSDDGSKLYLNDKMILDNDGLHGMGGPEIVLDMEAGYHKIRVEFFQKGGGMGLRLDVKTPDTKEFKVIAPENMLHHGITQARNDAIVNIPMTSQEVPGDKFPLEAVHPSFDIAQARPDLFLPKVGGMDFLPDGRMVISTWDPAGSVYIIDNVDSGDPSKIKAKLIGSGLAEPLGLKVDEDGDIYILQKQELTQLIDHNGDEIIDEYKTVCNDWKVSSNFHEFAFGLAYKDGHFYGTLATAIEAGGASSSPQIKDRGKVIKISKETGESKFVAHGLRTPNGIGVNHKNEIFVADNQGDWLPSSKIVHVDESKFDWFGSRSVDPEGTAELTEKQPVVWLPQDEIGNSPSQVSFIKEGVFKDQLIHGEVTHGGIKRVFYEKIKGQYQGVVFRFIQGLEAGVNRICWSPDNDLYVGGIGSTGNWGHEGKLQYGLQKLTMNENSSFEMKSVEAKSNGFLITMTEPLKDGDGWKLEDYEVKRWWYKPTVEYGGPKMDETTLTPKSVSVSDKRDQIFIEIDGLKERHVYYIRLKNHFVSTKNHSLWTTEAWYTMNELSDKSQTAFPQTNSYADNQLTETEKKDGWKLLFDGEDVSKNWHLYKKKDKVGKWVTQDGTMHFDPKNKGKGGDIVSNGEYQNYILELEWKIQDCGNSGIFFNVVEDKKYDATFFTGVEMQVLDNTCHPDARYPTHRAGDLYDMLSCTFETVKPAGQWNKVRLKIENGKVEHWLNGHKVVEYEMWTPEWDKMVANSKFNGEKNKEFADFGKAKKGHIALQDHGDKVWYRNIKIKELK